MKSYETLTSAAQPTIAPMEPVPRVVMLAAYRFPHGDAMSNRLLQLARSATPPGASTLIINDWPGNDRQPESVALPPELRLITLSAAGGGGRFRRWAHRQSRPPARAQGPATSGDTHRRPPGSAFHWGCGT